jgi:hypothetical protein
MSSVRKSKGRKFFKIKPLNLYFGISTHSWNIELVKRLRQDHQRYSINLKLFLQGPANLNFFSEPKKKSAYWWVLWWGTYAKCLEKDETVEHFLCRCSIFFRVRRWTLSCFELCEEELISADLKSIYIFFLSNRREDLGR